MLTEPAQRKWRGVAAGRRGGGKSQRGAAGGGGRHRWWEARSERARGDQKVAALTRLTTDYHYHYSYLSGATDSFASKRPL